MEVDRERAAGLVASPAVEVRDLVKRYPKGKVNAVDGVSFTVSPGEVFGLLGPNGAGKTTTVGILTTRVRRSSGAACVAGVDVGADPVRARRLVGVVPQRNNLDRSLSIRQNLLFHAAYHGVPAAERARRADTLLAEFGLADRAGEKPDMFSGGQAQRVMVARTLMHAPQVLFLDEPTTGLDPAARLFVWDRVRDLQAQGVTVVLTTHDMDEAAELADRVGIMDHGKLLALDTPDALTRGLPGRTTLEVAMALSDAIPPDDLLAALAALDGVERVEQVAAAQAGPPPSTGSTGGWPGMTGPPSGPPPPAGSDGDGRPRELRARLYVSGDAPLTVAPVATLLAERRAELTDVTIGTPSLEDVFINLTGRALR
ncbi:MAG TPA: ABC transporter ATP-binding protein [Actinomycetes bacterium]|nr:ABC transporter ATP-binding protein [Actinomycetes bacterium]